MIGWLPLPMCQVGDDDGDGANGWNLLESMESVLTSSWCLRMCESLEAEDGSVQISF